MPRLKEWQFNTVLGLFREPAVNTDGHEIHQTRLFGRVFDDSRRDSLTREFDDGHRVITSPVFEIKPSHVKAFIKRRAWRWT